MLGSSVVHVFYKAEFYYSDMICKHCESQYLDIDILRYSLLEEQGSPAVRIYRARVPNK